MSANAHERKQTRANADKLRFQALVERVRNADKRAQMQTNAPITRTRGSAPARSPNPTVSRTGRLQRLPERLGGDRGTEPLPVCFVHFTLPLKGGVAAPKPAAVAAADAAASSMVPAVAENRC